MSCSKKQNESDQSLDQVTPVPQDSRKNVNTVHYDTQLKPPTTSFTSNISAVTILEKPLSETKLWKPTSICMYTTKGCITFPLKLKPALVYIFNHENFDTENEPRRGSAHDEDALVKTFNQLKCEVQVIKDATVAKIKSTVQMLESKSFEEQSALVIVILTHGGRHDILAAKDSGYSLDVDVIFPILRNQTLINKPKLVFVQACKGANKLGSLKTDDVQHRSSKNILKCYSTYEGYVAYRDDVEGTPYIQTLCETLQKSGRTKDIEAIVMEVCDAVKRNTEDRQIPSFTSTLSSKYTFGDYM